ncbi:MAG: phosphoglycerate kinase [Phycisphaerales bacterium]|nr:phosphoglycerate kinase [Phycisphaerales bacterium]
MGVKTVGDLKVEPGQSVLIRADFNVPLRPDGSVLDDRRIRMALPTIETVRSQGGIAVCMSHLGRPAGQGPEPGLSLSPVADSLQAQLGDAGQVHFVEGACRGPKAAQAIEAAAPGDVVLLDNLRFEAGEKGADEAFAADLARLGDAYVNDAFGTAHRHDASMVALPRAMAPRPCVAGLLLEKELRFLGEAIESPRRPFVAVLGGAKVSDKLGAIRHLMERVDTILVGGAMAYTFLAARSVDVGDSLVERDMVDTAAALLDAAQSPEAATIELPVDHRTAPSFDAVDQVETFTGAIPEGRMGLDIGPASIDAFAAVVLKAGTIVWNGPMGVFERPPMDTGTRALAQALAQATKNSDAVSIVGGGETAAAVEMAGVAASMSHVSTGGGASLKMLEGASFEAVACLDQA